MIYTATITSKKQLTLPVEAFRQVGLCIGQKVLIKEENGSLLITSAEKLVENLAGSISLPQQWQNKDIDKIIEEAKEEYLTAKHKQIP